LKFFKKNPNKPWDFKKLSRNPNITWAIVEANLDKDWDFYELSKHPNITWAIVEANLDKRCKKEKTGAVYIVVGHRKEDETRYENI